MKTKILLSLLKTIFTWMVENYNPYANVTLFFLCIHQGAMELKWVLKEAGEKITATIRRLAYTGTEGFNGQTINRQNVER